MRRRALLGASTLASAPHSICRTLGQLKEYNPSLDLSGLLFHTGCAEKKETFCAQGLRLKQVTLLVFESRVIRPPKKSMSSSLESMSKLPYGRRGSEIKLRTLKWDDYPGLYRWARCNHKGTCKREVEKSESRCDERRSNDLESQAKDCRWPLEAEQGKGLSPKASRRNKALLTQFRPLTSRTVKEQMYVALSHVCGNLYKINRKLIQAIYYTS